MIPNIWLPEKETRENLNEKQSYNKENSPRTKQHDSLDRKDPLTAQHTDFLKKT